MPEQDENLPDSLADYVVELARVAWPSTDVAVAAFLTGAAISIQEAVDITGMTHHATIKLEAIDIPAVVTRGAAGVESVSLFAYASRERDAALTRAAFSDVSASLDARLGDGAVSAPGVRTWNLPSGREIELQHFWQSDSVLQLSVSR